MVEGSAPEPTPRSADGPTIARAADAATPPAADAMETAPDAAPTADVSAAGEDRRATLLALLRGIVNPTPPLDPKLEPPTTANGIILQELTISSTPTWRVQATLRRSPNSTGRLPVAICLHETGSDRDSPNVVGIATALTGKGFLTVAMSGRYFGKGGGNDAYVNAMKAAYANPGKDYPFLYDTVWDVMRLIDYLVTRDDVDPKRIGLLGISKGGMETYLAAALDPRVAAAAPIIGIQSFKWGLEHDAFQARADSLGGAVPNSNDATSVRTFYDRVAPGLVDRYDCPDMLPLIAPRPLIVLSGTQDPRNAITGVNLAVDAARPAYDRAGAMDRLRLFTANVGHDGAYQPFHTEAEAWLERWLGTPAP
jgi:dienelactone hydrolase